FDANELLAAIARVQCFADPRSMAIRLEVSPGKLRIWMDGNQVGEGEDYVETEYAGEPFTNNISATRLTDFLRLASGHTASLYFGDASKFEFKIEGVSNYTHVIAFMRT